MHWKVKAAIQNAISFLPLSASYASYYWIQRHFGELRSFDPTSRLSAGLEAWKHIRNQSIDPVGKVFLEVGTGRAPFVPIAYWLMGADKTITIDLNPYLKDELIKDGLEFISNHEAKVRALFGSLLDASRFLDLLHFGRHMTYTRRALLDLCRIEYLAPGNATETGLSPGSIDFHTSYTVLEHIPPKKLDAILREGNRIIRNDGLFVHCVDYSDHFAHSDQSISAINFLQFSARKWNRLAGNRYMYMNRMRHDDFLSLFHAVGHKLLEVDTRQDLRSKEILSSGALRLDGHFGRKSLEILSTVSAWIVSTPFA